MKQMHASIVLTKTTCIKSLNICPCIKSLNADKSYSVDNQIIFNMQIYIVQGKLW